MILNLINRSFSLIKSAVNRPIMIARSFTRTIPKFGLEEFFENGESFPIYNQDKKLVYGRAWKASELRNKSFDDLHKLWFVLLKERNLLATQEAESRRLGQMFFSKQREIKCKLSMARIKSVLTERQSVHNQATNLLAQKESGLVSTESDLALQENQHQIYKRAEVKRKVRKGLNYMKRRQVLFT